MRANWVKPKCGSNGSESAVRAPKISGGTNGHRQDTSATSWARLQISGKGNSEQAICSASHTNVKLLASGEIFRVSLNSTTLQERGFVSWLTSVVWIQLIFAVATGLMLVCNRCRSLILERAPSDNDCS